MEWVAQDWLRTGRLLPFPALPGRGTRLPQSCQALAGPRGPLGLARRLRLPHASEETMTTTRICRDSALQARGQVVPGAGTPP